MARSETRIKWSIWQTLQDVSPAGKLVYVVMLDQVLCALCNGRKGARV